MREIKAWVRREDLREAAGTWLEENRGNGELFDAEQVHALIIGMLEECGGPSLAELWVNKAERMPEAGDMDPCRCVLCWHEGAYGADVFGVSGMRTAGIQGIKENRMIHYWMPLPERPGGGGGGA